MDVEYDVEADTLKLQQLAQTFMSMDPPGCRYSGKCICLCEDVDVGISQICRMSCKNK